MWVSVDPTALRAWLQTIQNARPPGSTPRSYRLHDSGELKELMLKMGWHKLDEGKLHFQAESGLPEIDFKTELAESAAMTLVRRIAQSMDPDREFSRPETRTNIEMSPQGAVVDELTTTLNGLESIGPGGRCILYRNGLSDTRSYAAEITVRARDFPIDAKWRDAGEIEEVVQRVITAGDRDIQLRASFGYFEKSKFEPQGWLRPAFAFIVESADDSEFGFRRGFVEAATASPELDFSAGLEGWTL